MTFKLKWTDDLIKYEVLRLYNSNVDLSPGHIGKIYPSFFDPARHRKGDWKTVIEFVGLNYKEILHINRLTIEEKFRLFFDYIAMDMRKGVVRDLAKKYSIGYSTTRRHITQMKREYLKNDVELNEDFKKRFYNYIIEETKQRAGLNKISDLERKVLYRCGYRIIKEGTSIFLRSK